MKLINRKELVKQRKAVYANRLCTCNHSFVSHVLYEEMAAGYHPIKLPSFMAGYTKKGKKQRSYCRECTFQKHKHEFEESFESTIDVMRKIENLNESE